MPMTFGRGCGSGYQAPRCDCAQDCADARPPTLTAFNECLDECDFEGCIEDCATIETEANETADATNDTCRTDCFEVEDGCFEICVSTYDDCHSGCEELPTLPERAECEADCSSAYLDCIDPCQDDSSTCQVECEGTRALAVIDNALARLDCEEPCCSDDPDHAASCATECQRVAATARRAVQVIYNGCLSTCQPLANEDDFEAFSVCETACEAEQTSAHLAIANTAAECGWQCIAEEMRETEQCDWFYLACSIPCEEDYNAADEACAAAHPPCVAACAIDDEVCREACDADLFECRSPIVIERFECRLACCTSQHGNDPFTACHADCVRDYECSLLFFSDPEAYEVCFEDFANCLIDCRGPAHEDQACSDCGPRAQGSLGD